MIHFPPPAPAYLNARQVQPDQVRSLLEGNAGPKTELSGPEARALMDLAGTTVADVVLRWNVTRERVRQIRRAGTTGSPSVTDWIAMLTTYPQDATGQAVCQASV